MSAHDPAGPLHPPFALLGEAFPQLLEELRELLKAQGEEEISQQLASLAIATQKIGGPPDRFGVYVYVVPTLSLEERMRWEVQEERELEISIGNGRIIVDLDIFGRINFLHFESLPDLHKQFGDLLGRVSV